jgi:hypothetical protein
MIFSFMLFNRYGSCVFFEEWNRTRKVNMVEMKTNMYGLVFEMKRFIIKTSPTGYALPTPPSWLARPLSWLGGAGALQALAVQTC